MPLGFGSYRISVKSQEHRDALEHALDLGLDFIDTSANYTDGDSERLIGDVLKNRDDKPFIMTKGGYIQGSNLEVIDQLNKVGLAKEGLVKVNEGLLHSIHPDFIRNQVDLSLNRLGLECVDCYLLHNPEYYFYSEGATQEEYYQRIELAFSELEALVKEGKIRSYGISSNNFILSLDDPKVTNLERVIEAAEKVSENHSFKWIQFPFNLIEIGALEKHYDGLSLVDLARSKGIRTAINRPLNAFTSEKLVRLADYDPFLIFMDQQEGEKLYQNCLKLINEKIQSQGEDQKAEDIPLIKQFSEMYHGLPTEDAVQQVYMGHFFPLVAKIWGGDLSPEASIPFYDLYDYSCNRARQVMNAVAKEFEKEAISSGLIEAGNAPLQERVLAKYEAFGFDRILVGMKRKIYVTQLEYFIKS